MLGLLNTSQKAETQKKRESSFTKLAKESTSNSSTAYSNYAKSSPNKIHYNTGLGESKYDKEINLDTDVNPNDVKDSIDNFRTKKRNEEIIFYTKLIIGLIIAFVAFSYLQKYLKRSKIQ